MAGGKRIGINGGRKSGLSGIGIYADSGVYGGFEGGWAADAPGRGAELNRDDR